MFWLESIRLSNFRSFEKSEIPFPRTGLTLLKGKNLDTGGSSYSGKSSIALAVAFALDFCPFPMKDQRRWGSETPMFVELDIGSDKGSATIRKGDKPFLKLPDGRKVTSAAAIKEELGRFLGVDPGVLAALTYQQQKKSGRFLAKTDLEKKEFLSNVMPWLTKVEQAAEASDVKAKSLSLDLEGRFRVLEALESQFRSLVISEPVLVDIPNTDNLLISLTRDNEKATKKLANITDEGLSLESNQPQEIPGMAELIQAKEETVSRLKDIRTKEAARITYHSASVAELEIKINQALDSQNSIPELLKQIKKMEDGFCSTCEQSWITEKAAATLEQLKNRLKFAQIDGLDLPVNIGKRESLKFVPNPMIASLEGIQAGLDVELSKLSKEKQKSMTEWMGKIQTNQQKRYIINTEMALIDSKIKDATHSVQLIKKENEHRKQAYEVSVKTKEDVQTRINDVQGLIAKTKALLNAELDFQDMVGKKGFLGSIFDEVLIEVSDITNTILGSVANTGHVHLEFVSEVTTLKGNVNKAIKPIITINGNVADLDSGASGGMATSIHLAVDLAIASMVQARTNTWPGFMIQDESFEGLDAVSKESCFEMLKRFGETRLILVVDHANELTELFTQVVEVEYSNGLSRIV